MTIIKWDPFRGVSELQDRINRLFEESFPQTSEHGDDVVQCDWRPLVDVYETADSIFVMVDLPGVKKDNVAVEAKDNVLIIKGERRVNETVDQDGYFRKERSCGNFFRSLTFQDTIDPSKIKARFKDGELKIAIQKSERDMPKKIEVKVE